MKKLLTTTVITGVLAGGAMLTPAAASAGTVNNAARAYCNIERLDRQDFIRQYGSIGKAGMQRCIRVEKRLANRECRADLRNDRVDFIRQFGGTDRKAFQRCLRFELRN